LCVSLKQKEWEEREGKARAKFNQRYTKPADAESSSPGGVDKQRVAQEELRQRLALETKRMEDAEVSLSRALSLFPVRSACTSTACTFVRVVANESQIDPARAGGHSLDK